MTYCLMIYASVEYRVRQTLVDKHAFFLDMKKKPTQRPTAKWVFFCQGIALLTIDKQQQVVTNMMDRQRTILDCLRPIYGEFYSIRDFVAAEDGL